MRNTGPCRFVRKCALLLLSAHVLFLGCSANLPKPDLTHFERQEDAGSIQVGVQSVAPFEEYVDSLQPRFVLDEQGAFTAAISQTQILEIRQLEALLARLNIALPSSTRTVQEVQTRTNETQESSRTETEGVTPPAAPATTAPTNTATLGGVPAAPAGTVGTNAFTQYSAAASLFQFVALLNSFVREAAVSTNTIPYIVRLIVTVLPSARSVPYDAYATVSFFLDTGGRPTTYLAQASMPEKWDTEASLGCSGKELQIVPLFVTDNLESSSTTSARESLRGVDASLSGIVSNVGVGVGGTSSADASVGTRGIELNGIQTIAATSKNTVQLRLGAANYQGSFAAVPRTYNLTTLVLVPAALMGPSNQTSVLACEKIRFFAQSQFRSAETGKLLPSMPPAAVLESLKSLISRELCPSATSAEQMEKVAKAAQAAQATDFDAFMDEVKKVTVCDASSIPAVWPTMVSLVNSHGQSRGSIPLTKVVFNFFPLADDNDPKVPILDDGKATRVSLAGGERLEQKGLFGHLYVTHNGKKIRLQSTSATVTPDRRGATLTFPSIRSFFADIDSRATIPASADVLIEYAPTVVRWTRDPVIYQWTQSDCPILLAKEKPKATPGFDLRATANFIRAKRDGTGELAIEIKKTEQMSRKVLLRVSGAILGSVTPEILPQGAHRVADTDKAYVLSLRNLVGGTTVTVHSWRMEGEVEVPAPDVSLFVLPESGEERTAAGGRPQSPSP